jgi:FkbM family methyltransferase
MSSLALDKVKVLFIMLIPYSTIVKKLAAAGIHVTGILHIGAHECEELAAYVANGVPAANVDWIEANPELVARMAARGIKVHQAAVSDTEAELPFHITNNGQSSSLLEFGTHAASYPWCKVVQTITVKTEHLTTIIERAAIPIKTRNFWNLDIQGAELSALKSAGDALQYADAIYTEVNTQEVYKGCCLLGELDSFLAEKGFVRNAISMTGAGWGDALYIRHKTAVPK